jgi:glutamate N-acetyltransferase/amino-acid N-acetyltransferase
VTSAYVILAVILLRRSALRGMIVPSNIEIIEEGTVTSPKGYLASGTYAGLKIRDENALDLGILLSETTATVGATFTTNSIVSPSVTLSRTRVANGSARGVVVNSGCANCCVGEQGYIDAIEMTSLAARCVGVEPEEMLVGSTGLIGVELPMALIRKNTCNIKVDEDGGHSFAKSIMTTDTYPKEIAVTTVIDGRKITLGGVAKGVGMIHPNMATMLCFISTDLEIEAGILQKTLNESVDASFNMISVDGDQSTNDTVLAFANGASGISIGYDESNENGYSTGYIPFQKALTYICVELAKQIVEDGEGSERLIEVNVEKARTIDDARKAAKTIVSSSLVKSMIHGRDPNWGRVMVALGNSGAYIEESAVDIFINEIHIVHKGQSIQYLKDAVVSAMSIPQVTIRVSINLGDADSTAWGCDLTEEYVTLNSAYST